MNRAGEPHPNISMGATTNSLHKFSSATSSPSSSTSATSTSTADSLSNGKQSTSMEKCLAVTLMYSYTNGKKVLFMEAGKDLVDILLSFLTLPMGAIIKLLYGGTDLATKLDGAIFRVFNSVEKMEDDKFYTSKSKEALLDPKTSSRFGSKLFQSECSEQEIIPSLDNGRGVYYSCGMVPHCVYITKKLGKRCPQHGRKMQTLCRFVDEDWERNKDMAVPPLATGYVKDNKFFITDALKIYPSSKSLELMQKLQVDKISLLNNLDIFVGMTEILNLLKTSLTSTNVLQEVFGKIVHDRLLDHDDKLYCKYQQANLDLPIKPNKIILHSQNRVSSCDILQNTIASSNCKKEFDNNCKGRSHLSSRPSSTPNLQNSKSDSFTYCISRKLGCNNSINHDSKSLAKHTFLPYTIKRIPHAYKTMHHRFEDKRQEFKFVKEIESSN